MMSTLPTIRIDGELIDFEITPKVLFHGETGSGKSNAVHEILLGITGRRSPKELNLILHDNKRVEWDDKYLANYREFYPSDESKAGCDGLTGIIRAVKNLIRTNSNMTLIVIEEISDHIINQEAELLYLFDLIEQNNRNKKSIYLLATTSKHNQRDKVTDFIEFLDHNFNLIMNFNTNKGKHKIILQSLDDENEEYTMDNRIKTLQSIQIPK